MARTLLWFRGKDLRVRDHPALVSALAGELVPLFVLDPHFFEPSRARALPHRMQFLLESLEALRSNVATLGSHLLLVEGRSVDVVPELARRFRVTRVAAMRWTEPFGRERDRRVAAALEAQQLPFELFEGETLAAPGSVRNGGGQPFSVFTPFARALRRQLEVAPAMPGPRHLPPLPDDVRHISAAMPTLKSLGIAHNPRLLLGGESAARERLSQFLAGPAASYERERDRMDLAGTSRLSADLKFGTLSVRSVWLAAHAALEERGPAALASFQNELLWREFTHATLWDRPGLLQEPFRRDFVGFPWLADEAGWQAWVEGKTGYPVVDAAARQLLQEGFVHNRARMIAASFLTKHLLISYQRGEQHYMKYLTDGDWAQNNGGWQWSAGCGTDAQPYFRVFNPTLQGERFDPNGDYVRRYLPELARVPDRFVHRPATAPAAVLAGAGVRLGETYPAPIIDHALARDRFLKIAESHLKSQRR
jgi:deoxyribodipyrimidine photo-lyase